MRFRGIIARQFSGQDMFHTLLSLSDCRSSSRPGAASDALYGSGRGFLLSMAKLARVCKTCCISLAVCAREGHAFVNFFLRWRELVFPLSMSAEFSWSFCLRSSRSRSTSLSCGVALGGLVGDGVGRFVGITVQAWHHFLHFCTGGHASARSTLKCS